MRTSRYQRIPRGGDAVEPYCPRPPRKRTHADRGECPTAATSLHVAALENFARFWDASKAWTAVVRGKAPMGSVPRFDLPSWLVRIPFKDSNTSCLLPLKRALINSWADVRF